MKLIVLSVVSPPAELLGYARRFLMDFGPGICVGAGTRDLAEDLRGLMESAGAIGFLLVSAPRSEAGFEVLYYHINDRRLVDADGWILLERLANISSVSSADSKS